jgi:enamidase
MKTVITNIGMILTGKLEQPIGDGDCVVAIDGKIAIIGRKKDMDIDQPDTLIDAKGAALAPGLIDSHVHPVAGDWTPRQNQMGWIDSTLNGGVTTMISAGEVHTPGRPRDIVGLKALAISAQRQFSNFRPSGVKIHAGAPCIEPGMTEDDFKDLAAAGVTLLGEVGLGGVKDGPTARKMVAWARAHGIQSTIHTGGPSIPGSGLIDKDVVLEADTDVIGHINGGHTALPDSQIRCICEGCKRGLEIVHNGNERAALYTLRLAREMGELSRVILGTDGPAGSGVQPLGILRMVSMLSSLGDLPAEQALCLATGNTARMRKLDCGLIDVGRAADFVFLAKAQHSAGDNLLHAIQLGDLPGVGMVMIDGQVRCQRSRNTPPAETIPEILKQAAAAGAGGH